MCKYIIIIIIWKYYSTCLCLDHVFKILKPIQIESVKPIQILIQIGDPLYETNFEQN